MTYSICVSIESVEEQTSQNLIKSGTKMRGQK